MQASDEISRKKHILIFTGGFFPAKRYGGPVVSVANLCSLLKDEFKFFIVANDHDLGGKEKLSDIVQDWNEYEDYSVMYLSEDKKTAKTYAMIIDEVEPHNIYLNSLFDYKFTIPVIKIAEKKLINIILAPRGQLCRNAFRKKYKKIPYLIIYKHLLKYKNIKYQATSMEEVEAIKKYIGVERAIITLLENIPSIPKEKPGRLEKNSGSVRLIFLSRIHPKKNLIGAIKLIKDLEGDVIFDIYGPIEDEKYWDICQNEIKKCRPNIIIRYMGEVAHDKIHEAFGMYHFFLFPTFSENYGHVIVESMLAGTPVILSDQTPWNDVEKNQAGWAVPLVRIEDFAAVITYCIRMKDYEYNLISQKVLNYINDKTSLSRLKNCYFEFFLGQRFD